MKKLTCLLLCLCMVWGCVCVQAEDDRASRYQQGMQLIAEGKYTEAYNVFMGLAGYEDANDKAYALGFTKVAMLEKLSDTSAIIRFSGLFGMVDFSTNTVTPPQWVESKKLGDNRLAVKKGILWGVIDGTGKTIFPEQWFDISNAEDGLCVTYSAGLYGLINIDGTELLKCEWKQIGSSVFVEDEGYELYRPSFYCGLIRVQDASGIWGYVDRTGKAVIAPQYYYADEFDSNTAQAAVLTLSGYLTVIDTNGEDKYFTNPTYFATRYQADYDKAVALRDEGKYDEAVTMFTDLGVYSDAATQVKATYYAKAEALLAKNDYDGAVTTFQNAGNYSDAATRVKATYYAKAEALLASGDKDGAVTAFRAAGDYQDAAARARANFEFKAGAYITFGHYPQTAAWIDNTPIEWLVLKVQGNQILVISRYGLDAHAYQPGSGITKYPTWEKSDIRQWLNSTFLNKAFTAEEQADIITVSISTPAYKGNSGGADTQDKIWLLSREEAETYFKDDVARMATPTGYAVARGAYQSSNDKLNSTWCWWWLRSPGFSSYYASGVYCDGSLDDFHYVHDTYGSVRPAFWLNLDSPYIH